LAIGVGATWPIVNANARLLPVTHGLQAARRIAQGDALGGVWGLVLTELAVAAAYAAVGYTLHRHLEHAARRNATLESA